jgi:glucosylglycerate hydrolase
VVLYAGADPMAEAAIEVLRRNDLGGWTKAAPRLYPHQWSWDSAFIAIGLAHVDTARAAQELRSLFAAQWATGLVPHIVFNPDVPPGSYFPDAECWNVASLTADVPQGKLTSGLIQPPVHAIAAWRIREVAARRGDGGLTTADAFLREIYPKLFDWHRYLLSARDPEESGLVTIYHPWESGLDNSPRWDPALAAVKVGELEPYTRFDLQHVADPSQRPTNEEYDRYLWLVELLKQARYDDTAIRASEYPFMVKDTLISGILVAANEALLRIAEIAEAPDIERRQIAAWIERGRHGLDRAWDAELGLALDYDVGTSAPGRVRTIAGFAPLVAGGLSAERQSALLATLDSEAFLGDSRLRWPIPPSTSPLDPAFRPRSYWRGPTWPVLTWLYWWALTRDGETELADRLRAASLDQIGMIGFAEYVEPFTGEPLGSLDQSWTAAVTLDWLASRQPK